MNIELKINVIWAIVILMAIGMVIYERLSKMLSDNGAFDEGDRILLRIMMIFGLFVIEMPLIHYWIN